MNIDDRDRLDRVVRSSGMPARTGLVQRWARALCTTVYVPASFMQIQDLLEELLAALVGALLAEEFCPDPGREVGKLLVSSGFRGEHSLSRTIEVLGQALPADPDLRGVVDLASRTVSVLGAVAAGYVAALRALTLDQQEEVKQALLMAKEDAERELRVSEAKFRELFTSSAVGIAISELDGRLLEINQALREIVGDSVTGLAGREVYELFDVNDAAFLKSAHQRLMGGKRVRYRLPQRLRLIDKDGEPAWTYLAISLLHDADGQPIQHVTIVEDVTELHLLGERLAHQSLHDALTGLPNQQFFLSRLEGVLGRAGLGARITVCTIDVDRLAVINDAFGREVGDQVLCSVAGRLQSVVSDEEAMVARLGSDEFAVFLENSATTTDVTALAVSMHNELARPLRIQGHELVVSGCLGIAEHHGDGGEPVKLLRAAEAALHDAKSSGKGRWRLWDAHRDADERHRCRLAAALSGARDNGEISLLYQPMTRLSDGKIVAVEVLLRWDHPQSGSLAHHECRELAARTGVETALGEWLLRSACAHLRSWRQHVGELQLSLHVDFTSQQFLYPELVTDIRCALEHAGLAASRLQIGVPVNVLDTEGGQAADNVRALIEMGIAIVLLGFSGVGHLTYLQELPIRVVEIAHRIVQQVAQRPADASEVAGPVADMLHMVHRAGAMSIVRGIQTQNQADWWRLVGADVGQGTFCASPRSSEQIVALLGSRRAAGITDICRGNTGHP